ncbi:MAG: sigma-70 family RNA polymerase sigma factor [Clostridiales Family XIII bacterium]|jgi:RNA polymerase sigma-70 factor (ECF subfamily)|nr:sigma-70 family RNA polymerase sigma factor [Clostridiales Family XIII bacterium]
MDKSEMKKTIRRAMGGDKKAFTDLYGIFIKSILFHTSELLHDKNKVEDVAQEVVIKMYQNIGSLKKPEAFRSWVNTIVANACSTENARACKHNGANIDDYENILEAQSIEALPDEAAERSLTEDILMEAIDRLPKARKQTLMMYYYDDMSYKEIANVLGVTDKTVSTNILRAKEMIKQDLQNRAKPGKETKENELAFLTGAAFGPALARSLAGRADAMFPDAYCREVAGRIDTALGNIPAPAASADTGGLGHVNTAGVLIAGALAVTAGVYGFYSYIDSGSSQDPGNAGVFQPDAVIIFENESAAPETNKQINPVGARLERKDAEGRILEWKILSIGENERVVAKNAGADADAELKELPPGNYRIEWRLQNDAGNAATIVREFLIEPDRN